jgi:hypothetical protein
MSADWSLWQTFLKQGILGRGWRLKQPLGEWDHTADNPWHYCSHEDATYHISQAGSFRFSCIPRNLGKPRFNRTGSVNTTIFSLQKATIFDTGHYLILTGQGNCQTTPSHNYCSFESYLNSLKFKPGYWFLHHVQLPQDCKSFTSELAAGLIIAVSDGSYFSQYGTAA